VTFSLLGIGKNGVGFGSFLKVLLRLGIALVLIWMMLMGQPPVGTLQILFSRRMADAQNFIIVALINSHNRKYQ